MMSQVYVKVWGLPHLNATGSNRLMIFVTVGSFIYGVFFLLKYVRYGASFCYKIAVL